MHKTGNIDFDDLQSERSYRGMKVYANSKLMITMYTYELARRLEGTEITVNVVEPGFVATNLGRNSGSRLYSLMYRLMRPIQMKAKKGAETSVYLASSDEVKSVTGKCFSKQQQTKTAQITYNQEIQNRLWYATMELLGLNS